MAIPLSCVSLLTTESFQSFCFVQILTLFFLLEGVVHLSTRLEGIIKVGISTYCPNGHILFLIEQTDLPFGIGNNLVCVSLLVCSVCKCASVLAYVHVVVYVCARALLWVVRAWRACVCTCACCACTRVLLLVDK